MPEEYDVLAMPPDAKPNATQWRNFYREAQRVQQATQKRPGDHPSAPDIYVSNKLSDPYPKEKR